MKFVSFCDGKTARYGLVQDGRIIDLTQRLGDKYPDLRTFMTAADWRSTAETLLRREDGEFAYDDVELLPVIPEPGKVLCVALNYHDHVKEADRALGGREVPRYPMMFLRCAESLAGHRVPLMRPRVSTELDYEAELLVVIGRPVPRYVPKEKALDFVFGYAAMNEGSVRSYQFHNRQLTPGKNFQQTGGTGPWIVTADEIADPQDLQIEMRLNGMVMQSANTKDMIFSVADIIAYVSEWLPLKPGDLIASGTMGGVGFSRETPVFMKPGDRAEVIISGIGTLSNSIEDEPAEAVL